MDANELRIGNYIHRNFEIQTVFMIRERGDKSNGAFQVNYASDTLIQPLPLNEKLFLLIGAEKWPGGKNQVSFHHNVFEYYECRAAFVHVVTGTEVPTVHKLQNLMHALYGIECLDGVDLKSLILNLKSS